MDDTNELRARLLHAKVMAGEMVQRTVNGISYSVWKQSNEFVMVQHGGPANPLHELLVDSTSPERLAAHWDGFCGIEPPPAPKPLKPVTVAQAAAGARATATTCKENASGYGSKTYLAQREAEVVSANKGGRLCREPIFIPLSQLNGKTLGQAIACLKDEGHWEPGAEIWVLGGLDLWESFWEFCNQNHGYDYTPRVEDWEYRVPDAVVDSVKA